MAPIICHKTRVVYYPVPKNGSSALRDLFFELENGFPFRPFFINGKRKNLFWLYRHNEYFRAVPIPEGYAKFAVVRHPIKRFISCYTFAVLEKRLPGVDYTLDFHDFVERMEDHLCNSALRFHLSPQYKFLGPDLAFFDKVFPMEAFGELSAYLSERSGAEVKVPLTNTSRQHTIRISNETINRLRSIYEDDFELLKSVYGG